MNLGQHLVYGSTQKSNLTQHSCIKCYESGTILGP